MPEQKASEGVPVFDDAKTVTTGDKSLMELTTALLRAINQQNSPYAIRKAALHDKIGTTAARVNAILNPGPQKATKISLDVLGKVVVFARQFARSVPDAHFRDLITGYCNEIAQRLHDRLERGGLNPTENAFVTNLRLLDEGKQQQLSDRHAGVYALIRLDRDAHILISRMDVRPRQDQLCRFATDSGNIGTSEPAVEGYIYAVDDRIQAVGRPAGTSWLRVSILRSHRMPASTGWDMIGLRIGISEWDGGPFAYRTYCRQIANADWVGEDLPGWADLFGARRYAAIDEIEAKIADVATF